VDGKHVEELQCELFNFLFAMMLPLAEVDLAIRRPFLLTTSLAKSRDDSWNFKSRPGISRPVQKRVSSVPGRLVSCPSQLERESGGWHCD
jgi:hypothetical protein